ncbi:MAG: nicotinate-nicotinamide nucleotide adenylyltransferase [Candidatus Saccharimonadaceae bacterium]
MNQVKTIIYGGAFNPPTLAHVSILRACFEYAESINAEVWMLPSGDRYDKTIPVARDRRLEYIDALITDASRGPQDTAEIKTTELDRTISVETTDTVAELEANYPDRSFIFVFGADSTETMGQWKGGDTLLETLAMLVVERAGSTINPAAQHATPLKVQTTTVSSTLVRERMLRKESVDELVSPSVARLLT